jgi:hypothetical protein
LEHYLSGAQLTDGTDTKPLTDKSEYLKAFYGVLLSSEQKKTKKKDGNAKHAYCRLFAVKAASKQHLGVGTGGCCCLLLHRIESAMHLQLQRSVASSGANFSVEDLGQIVGSLRSDSWATYVSLTGGPRGAVGPRASGPHTAAPRPGRQP